MGVEVDKARRDQFAAGVDLLGPFAGNAADFGDAAAGDRNVRFEQFAAEAVGDAAAADHQVGVMGHDVSSRGWIFCCQHHRV